MAVLGFAAFAVSLAQTTVVPALDVMERELATNATSASWTVSSYLLAAAAVTTLIGRLGDMFGKRRILSIALICFTVGSLIAALASSVEVVILGRTVQGIGGGVLPLCFAIARDELPAPRVAVGIGMLSAILSAGGVVGLLVGGFLLDHYSFQALFWVGVALGLAGALSTHLLLPESRATSPGRIDVRGTVLFAGGIVPLLIAISSAGRWGIGDPRVLALATVGVTGLAAWYSVARRTPEPMVDIDTLRSRPVLLSNVASILMGFAMFGGFVLVPQLLQAPDTTPHGFGLTPTQASLALVPGVLVLSVVASFSGRITRWAGWSGPPLLIGAVLTGVGFLLLAVRHDSLPAIVGFYAFMSIGVGLTFAAMPNLILESVSPRRSGEATGFNTVVRLLGCAIGAQACTAILLGSVDGTQLPSDDGYRTALFSLALAAMLAAATTAALWWRRPRIS